MKKTKILTVVGVILAMGLAGCNGGGKSSSTEPASQSSNPPASTSQPASTTSQPASTTSQPASTTSQPASTTSQPTSGDTSGGGSEHTHSYGEWSQVSAPTCTEAGSQERECACGDKQTEAIPALGHDFASENAVKVDAFEEEGALAEEMYKCSRCNETQLRWAAKDYNVDKTTARSTKKPEDRDSNKAIRFDSTVNYQGEDTSKKGCHIVYDLYIPAAAQNLKLEVLSSRRTTDNPLPPVFNKVEGDTAKGYVEVDGALVRPATRYGLKIDGQEIVLPADESGQTWKDGNNWYVFPGTISFAEPGLHEFEIYNLGGYRVDFYNFALSGFGAHEHVINYKAIDSRLNSDEKTVYLGEDKFLGNKAIEIAFKDFSTAPVNPSGTNPWYMAKNSFAEWKIEVDKAIEGAKIYFSLECSSTTHIARHLFNEAKYNEAHPDAPVPLPSQSPDTTAEDDWRYAVAVGETNYPLLNDKTLGESGVKEVNKQYYVYFTDINLAEGENVIRLTQCNMGYRMKFNQNVRIVYNTDAVITGTHAHLFTQLVSETPATCEGKGSKVMKCLCGETETVETPALGHDFVEGTAENDVTPLTCSRCGRTGYQFNGLADNAVGNNAGANDNGKLNKNATLTWTLNLSQAGTVKVYIDAAYSAGNGNKAFASGWSIKGGASVDALEDGTLTLDTTARADSVLKQQSNDPSCYTYLEIGTVTAAAAGAYVIQITTYGSSAQARLMVNGLARVVYAA